MGSELTKRVDESKAAKRIGNTRLVKEIKRSEFGQKLKSMVDQRRVDERPTTSRDADDPDGVVMEYEKDARTVLKELDKIERDARTNIDKDDQKAKQFFKAGDKRRAALYLKQRKNHEHQLKQVNILKSSIEHLDKL